MAVEVNIDDIDRIVADLGSGREALVPILQAIQRAYNYLPGEALRRVAESTDISPASIAGVSTFYAQFRLEPAGRHFIKICIGTACYVKGAETVFEAFKRHLKIPRDRDTDDARLFTVEKVACLGCCTLAPAVQIDDITYGFVESAKVGGVLNDFLKAQEAPGALAKQVSGKGARGEASICLCSSCVAGGSSGVYRALLEQVEALGLRVAVKNVGCTGISYQTPLIKIRDSHDNQFHYGLVKKEDVRRILLRHFKPVGIGRATVAAISGVLEQLLTDETWEPVTRYSMDLRQGPDASYLSRQKHLATEHCGDLDPVDMQAYRSHDGFKALCKCVEDLSPAQVIGIISESRLRGRGGAGFPAGDKWSRVAESTDEMKYLICNGDEGDPGAFMDRMLLESFPLRVIEGICIAAYATGVEEGYVYIRAEYPLAARRVRDAIKLCREQGLIGESVLGTGRRFNLKVMEGAGAFVCGEETALIAAIEGKRGMPRYRPPYPAVSGLWGKPTLINNVETFAVVPWIIREGAAAFAALGKDESKGTKAFALAGKTLQGGLIEVPMGITLREIVDDIGGGIYGNRTLKAVQVGGPSGGCIPVTLVDTPVDYEDLVKQGAMMGSGGMVVLDDSDCMVDVARYFLAFTQAESCGKCTFCRIGTKRMLEILEALCEGRAEKDAIPKLEHLAKVTMEGSLCGLGRTAPNPVISTLDHFRSEYEAHVEGRCPAHRCKSLIRYYVTDKCIGCTKCAQQCPAEAIEMRPYEQHEIDVEKCTRCDGCRVLCPAGAIEIGDLEERDEG